MKGIRKRLTDIVRLNNCTFNIFLSDYMTGSVLTLLPEKNVIRCNKQVMLQKKNDDLYYHSMMHRACELMQNSNKKVIYVKE